MTHVYYDLQFDYSIYYFCSTISHLNPSNVAVIREVYDGEYSQQCFSMELEKALNACCTIIVIEPAQLGDETARWIAVGNGIHKTAVTAAACSILSGKGAFLVIRHNNKIKCFRYSVAPPAPPPGLTECICNIMRMSLHGVLAT